MKLLYKVRLWVTVLGGGELTGTFIRTLFSGNYKNKNKKMFALQIAKEAPAMSSP